MLAHNRRDVPPEQMEPITLIRASIAASIAVHLVALFVIVSLADVRMFGSTAGEPIVVDLISQDEAPPAPNLETPSSQLPAVENETPTAAATPADQNADQKKKPTASLPANPPKPTAVSPSVARQAAAAPPAPQAAPPASPEAPRIAQPEPDLSVRYPVMLGLPVGGDFDARAESAAGVGADVVAAFRRHLRRCSTMPPGITRGDKLRIVIRVTLSPDGSLLTPPTLIEASASPKGPALMKGATDALTACQPYAMLPADKYDEWKILDLSFTPQDLAD